MYDIYEKYFERYNKDIRKVLESIRKDVKYVYNSL